ncbi:MAG: esterase-like activity of phytase family protein [Pseudomonadota bacterium]
MKFVFVSLLALLLAACGSAASQQAPDPDQWRNIELTARPAAPGAARVGALTFRGGLELHSSDPGFGGWSGLDVLEDGRVIAISDTGVWLSARLVLDDAGALVGLAEPRMAAMRDEHGDVFPDKISADAEDVTQMPDGRFAVSFEQTQTIRIYDLNRDGPFGAAQPGPRLAETERLPPNEGLEALTTDGSGAFVVGAEHGERRGHMIWIAPFGGQTPVAPAAYLRMGMGYGLAGFDRLPDGDYVALERFYAPVIGVRIRLERIARASLATGTAAAREIAYLAPPLAIDNFEGVASVPKADGGVRLYLISDDNFSSRQRTLLYAFDLDEAPANSPR